MDYQNYKIVVVDNGSADNSGQIIKDACPKAEIVISKKNLGFSGGNNLGIKASWDKDPTYFLLLNNDTVVDKRLLNCLIGASSEHPSAGIIAPVIYDYYEPERVCFYSSYISRFKGPVLKPNRDKNFSIQKPLYTSLISGCCMLIKKEVFESVGLLDENYFLYYEDGDFCFRTVKNHWDLLIASDAKIWHKEGSSSGKDIKKNAAYYFSRNLLYFFSKNHSNLFARLPFLGYFYLSKSIRFVQWFLQGKKEPIRYTFYGIKDYHRGKMGKADC